MIKFPSIEQFRNVIREVQTNHDYKGKTASGEPIYTHDSPYPKLRFKGTVKLHGTNAALVRYKDGRTEYQSRERVLSITQDNANFMLSMSNKNIDFLFADTEFNEYIAVFGEWCGEGIQKGVGISQLPKMFVVFACNVDGNWVELPGGVDPSQQIYNINQFPNWELEIDFENPMLVQNDLVALTLEVENECPVARSFGISGVGEGIVWSTDDRRYVFKVKGEKHSSSKVKTLANVNVEEIESINAFVDYALTESRLKQGLDKLREMGLEVHQKSTGDFLRWIVGDIMKEEMDTIITNQLDPKKLNPVISKKAKEWFFNNI